MSFESNQKLKVKITFGGDFHQALLAMEKNSETGSSKSDGSASPKPKKGEQSS
jgi:hypothetical protein